MKQIFEYNTRSINHTRRWNYKTDYVPPDRIVRGTTDKKELDLYVRALITSIAKVVTRQRSTHDYNLIKQNLDNPLFNYSMLDELKGFNYE